MARRGRGKIKEPRIPTTKTAPTVKRTPINVAEMGIDFSAVMPSPVAPSPAVAPTPAPPPATPAPVPVPQIDPAVLAQIQEQFNIRGNSLPVQAPPPPPPVQVAPPRIEEPPKAPPPVQVPPPSFRTADFQDGNGNGVDDRDEPVAPPPPAAVAPPPPPPPVQPQVPPAIPQIDPEILAQIQQEFNIPAAPPAPPVAPPVQVPPPVMQPAPPPPAAVAPPPPPVQVPPPTFVDDFEEPLPNDMRRGIGSLPEAPPEAVVPPPVQVPPPVVQPAPVPEAVQPPPAPVAQEFSLPPRRISEPRSQPVPEAGPGMPTPSGGFLPGIDLNNLDLSGLAVPNQVQPAPEAVAPPPVVQPAVDPSLYSDPELGVEPGFGGTRGVSPMSPREQMGSNYIEPRDGPGQVPPGQTVDISEPTGIETMAASVGQGDYLDDVAGDTSDTISLPDGSTFDLGNLDLSGIDIGGFGSMSGGFDLNNVNVGGEQAFDPFAGVTGGLGPGGYGPEGGGFTPPYNTEPGFDPVEDVMSLPLYDENGNIVGEPAFNPPQGAVDEAVGTTYTPEFAFDPGLDFSGLDLSGLNLNLGDGFDANGFEGDFTFGGSNNNIGNQGGNQGGDVYNPTVNDTGNPYPFIPDGIDTSQMTPDMLAGLNTFYENGGIEGLNLNFNGMGGNFPGGFMGDYTPGSGTGDGSYTVDPVDPVGDLGVGDDTGDASDPIDVTTPYVPPNVRSASSYSLTGATPTRPVSPNPFQRPESQQGLGSLAGGG